MTAVASPDVTPAPRQRPRGSSPFVKFLKSPILARMLFPVAVLIFWVLSIRLIHNIWPFAAEVLASPLDVLGVMWDEINNRPLSRTNLYRTFGLSLQRLGIGFLISMVLGTAIGLGMGMSKSVDAFFHDWVMALLAMPALAWALFLSLIFGFGDTGPILAVILAGIPFVIVNVREGVRNTPRELFDMARAFGVPSQKATRHVLIPSLLPFMFAAVRYAFSIGWKGLVITEVFGGQDGAGWTIKFWYDAHRLKGVIGYSFFFVLFALFVERLILEPISRKAFKWRPDAGAVAVVEEDFDLELVNLGQASGAKSA